MEEKEEVKERLNKLEDWQTEMNTKMAIVQADVKTLKEKLNRIDSNTTWLLRIIVGAIVLALLGMIFENPSLL